LFFKVVQNVNVCWIFFVGIVFLTCAYVSDLRDVFILRISGSYSEVKVQIL